MKTLVVATGNAGKLKEIKEILGDKYEIVSQKQAGFDGDVEETGTTFFENALIKAKAVSEALGVDALADDSGLCVEALGGQPGVYSARYACHGDDKANREKLLSVMRGEGNRRAQFVSAVVLYRTVPSSVGLASSIAGVPSNTIDSIRSSKASANLYPSALKILIPLNSAGLWEAEIITPAWAL